MDFTIDPSNPIESFRYPNLPIVDNAGILKSSIGTQLGYSIDSKKYYLISKDEIKLLLYTSIGERINWKNINLSSNNIAVFIFKYNDKLQFRIKISDNLCPLSRFKSNQDMLSCLVTMDEKQFKSKQISIEYILSLFDTLEEPLFNLAKEQNIKNIQKSIRLFKRGSLSPILPNPVIGKLNITIGLFFDGTGNNKFNTKKVHDVFADLAKRKGKNFSEIINDYRSGKVSISEKGMGFADFMFAPKSSYLNSKSNITKLYNLYNGIKENEIDISKENGIPKEIVLKIYLEGIGTKEDQEDTMGGSAFGRGEYGILVRADEAIQKISKIILQIQKKYKTDIGEVLFDIFGFSRGAATARLFYSRLFDSPKILHIDGDIRLLAKKGNCKIRFYGLFDTVLSTFNADAVYPTEKDISLTKCKSPCYHITAQDEVRENFPLTHIEADNCVQLELYGAHSDIGGGYTKDKFTLSFAFEEQERVIELKKVFNDHKLLYAINTSNKNYLSFFVNQMTIKQKQVRYIAESLHSDSYNSNKPETKIGFVAQDNRIIEPDISAVSLNAMLSFAKQHNIPFEKYEVAFDEILIEKDKEILSKYNSKVQDLITKNKDVQMDVRDINYLYNKFVHISENYDYTPDLPILKSAYVNQLYKSLNYIDQPTKDRKRVEYLKL